MTVTSADYGQDHCVVEHDVVATVPGEFLGVPGGGREIAFRMLHVWGFRDGRICREQVWLDGGAIVAQLTAPAAQPAAVA
jgi:predicted ester cyclase